MNKKYDLRGLNRLGALWLRVSIFILAFLMSSQATRAFCFDKDIDVERLATAIYFAEGGEKTSHPYGILTHYKTTTPKQACINTINHALKDWDGKGDFISFLGSRYCPVGASNDPTGLNVNWIKNVTYFYNREER